MKSRSTGSRIIAYFMQGLLYLAPLTITIYILYLGFVYVDGLLDRHITEFTGRRIPGLGIFIIFAGITLIGFLGSTILFKPFARYLDKIISRAPLIKIIYTSLKDFFSAFVGHKRRFNEPVLIRVNKDTELPAANISPVKASPAEVMKFIVSAGITDIESKYFNRYDETQNTDHK